MIIIVHSLSAVAQNYKENTALAVLTCSLSLFFRVEAMETVIIAISLIVLRVKTKWCSAF